MESKEETIEKYIEYCKARGLSERRIMKLRYIMKNLSAWLETGFREATREDIQKLVNKIQESDFKDWTKSDHKKGIKQFYKWLEGDGEEVPKKVRWIKIGLVRNQRTAEDMLTEEEIKQMIENAPNVRDRAIISVLYESGCRVGELLGLKIKGVQNKGEMVILHVSGKTGERPIPIIDSVPYLLTWINNHPEKDNSDAYVFVRIIGQSMGEPLGYWSVNKMLRDTALKVRVNRKVNPHNFRHSRATHMASKLKEPQMRIYFGWGRNSTMPGTYVHHSARDIESAILEANGIKRPDESDQKRVLARKTCPRCNEMNGSIATVCMNCGLPLTDEEKLAYLDKKQRTTDRIEEIIERKLNERIEAFLSNSKPSV